MQGDPSTSLAAQPQLTSRVERRLVMHHLSILHTCANFIMVVTLHSTAEGSSQWCVTGK